MWASPFSDIRDSVIGNFPSKGVRLPLLPPEREKKIPHRIIKFEVLDRYWLRSLYRDILWFLQNGGEDPELDIGAISPLPHPVRRGRTTFFWHCLSLFMDLLLISTAHSVRGENVGRVILTKPNVPQRISYKTFLIILCISNKARMMTRERNRTSENFTTVY